MKRNVRGWQNPKKKYHLHALPKILSLDDIPESLSIKNKGFVSKQNPEKP